MEFWKRQNFKEPKGWFDDAHSPSRDRYNKSYFPPASGSAVVGEGVADPGVDVVQTQLPLRRSCYCHGDERGVAVGRFAFGAGGGVVRHRG